MQEPAMDAIQTTKRIHPLMATAAISVIIVSAAATAAVTGLLPSSHSATQAQGTPAAAPDTIAQAAPPAAQPYAQPGAPAQPYAQPFAQPTVAAAAPAPLPAPASYAETARVAQQSAPVVHKTPRPVVHHRTEVARNDSPNYEQRQAEPAPSQPNYVAIGTGAVIGGLLGNHVGSGNGRKLATVAGVIGGGMLGNEVANRNR
jgi:uncharacterized protein YcfJ